VEFRGVGAGGKVNLDSRSHAFRGYVELGQRLRTSRAPTRTMVSSPSSDCGLPSEDVDGHSPFLERSRFSCQRLFANVLQEFAGTVCCREKMDSPGWYEVDFVPLQASVNHGPAWDPGNESSSLPLWLYPQLGHLNCIVVFRITERNTTKVLYRTRIRP